jgi:hypothetical protein
VFVQNGARSSGSQRSGTRANITDIEIKLQLKRVLQLEKVLKKNKFCKLFAQHSGSEKAGDVMSVFVCNP